MIPNSVKGLSNSTACPMLQDIRLSQLPSLIDTFNYIKPDIDLIEHLNYDFRLSPNLMHAIVKLHAGAIVYSEDGSVLLLTCETYCRSKSVDVHAETSMKSIPVNEQSLFVGICEESDGHGNKNKLKIGSYHMNVLSTMSVNLGSSFDISIGASTNLSPSSSFSIVYLEANSKKYKHIIKAPEEYNVEENINSIRQLVSGFGNITTYKGYGASIDLLEKNETLMPATVFNLCDLAGNDNYGVSDSAPPMICSKFLNLMASATLVNLPYISKPKYDDAILTFEASYNKQVRNHGVHLPRFLY